MKAAVVRTSEVQLINVTKAFGKTLAVDRLDLDIRAGEFFAIVGPSGCGKTTTLRMIGGLEAPSTGSVHIRGADVTNVPAFRRNIGMVFQNYALFPHMTVFDNIAFGLRMRGWPHARVSSRVNEMLHVIRLPEVGRRYPLQLSGGEQQRVALARAVAPQPAVLLLDEPLSNLDLKLRQELRLEIRRIQRELSIATIFVTHDQGEALSLSDRVLVMRGGRRVQMGAPVELYEQPKNRWVASFLGDANIFRGHLRADGSGSAFVTGGGLVFSTPEWASRASATEADIAIRPEAIRLLPADTPEDTADTFHAVRVENFAYGGSGTRYLLRFVKAPTETVLVDSPEAGQPVVEGTQLLAAFPRSRWIRLEDE